MIFIRRTLSWALVGVLAVVTFATCSFGQTSAQLAGNIGSATAITADASPTALKAILEQRRGLIQQEQSLQSQGASREAILQWRQKHATDFTALTQKLQAWSTAQPRPALRTMVAPLIPANATPEMKEFLNCRMRLGNSLAEIQNQRSAEAVTFQPTISAVAGTLNTQRSTQTGSLLQRQQQLAKVIAGQQATRTVKMPDGPNIPPNATPQLSAFLTARYQIIRQKMQLLNQYATADPAARRAALSRWRQQNQAAIGQLQKQAQAISAASSTSLQASSEASKGNTTGQHLTYLAQLQAAELDGLIH